MTPSRDRPRCSSLTQAGDQCRNRAMVDRKTCKAHSGDANVGQPSKLTRERADALADLLRKGNYRERAAQAVGVHRTTFYGWLERAELEAQTLADPDTPAAERARLGDSDYLYLLDVVTRAEAEAETSAVETIRKHFPVDWRSAAWYLERRHPDKWRRRDSVSLEDAPVSPERDVEPDTEATRREIAEVLAEAGAVQSGGDNPPKRTRPAKGRKSK